MTPSSTVLIKNGLVPDTESRTLEHRDVLIKGGLIEAVTAPDKTPVLAAENARILDASNSVVLPGFVNAHTHSYGMLARHLGPELPLEPWMMYSWAVTGNRTPQEVRLSAQLQGVEALLTGTTTVMDHLGGEVDTISEAAQAYADLGLRAAIAPMISDIPLHRTVGVDESTWTAAHMPGLHMLTPPSASNLLAGVQELHAHWHGAASGRIAILLGPSAPQRCSNELLRGCAELSAEWDVGVHTHLLETRVQAQEPAAGLARLDDHGLVTHRLLAAHAVWVDANELSRLAAVGASLVHNPQSNLQLGSGIGELPRWRSAGINAALGTDGANCGGSLNMLSSMRLAAVLHRPGVSDERRWESPWTVLDLATHNGARALGLQRVGRLAIGWKADLAIFSMSGTSFIASEDPLASLILSSTSALARHVLVDGEVVVKEGAIEGVTMQDLTSRATEARLAIMERNRERIKDVAEAQQDVLAKRARDAPPPRPVVEFLAD